METEPKKPDANYIVVGINLLIMVVYTAYCRHDSGEMTILSDAFFIAVQVVLCLILCIFMFRKAFLLSAVLVLLVGFSSCAALFF